jgi:hypothetical protein
MFFHRKKRGETVSTGNEGSTAGQSSTGNKAF